MAEISSLENEIDNIDNTLLTLTDNGDTYALQNEVESSTPTQSADVYNDLMLSSEYLSNDVLLSSVEKDDVLNNNQITDILIVNPQGVKEQEILDELNNRNQPLTQNQWTQVLAGQETVGSMENNIAEKNMHLRDIKKLETDITRIYLENDQDPNSLDNAYNHLLTREERFSKYFGAFSALERKDVSLVNTIMTEVYSSLETSEDFSIHQNMLNLISITSDYFNGVDNTFPTTLQVSQLTDIVNNGFFPGLLAKNLLITFNQIDYEEPIVESSLLKNSQVEWTPVVAPSQSGIEIYPNPASDKINISISGNKSDASFEIYSQTGQSVLAGHLNEAKLFHTINISTLTPGLYTISIYSNSQQISTQKISVR